MQIIKIIAKVAIMYAAALYLASLLPESALPKWSVYIGWFFGIITVMTLE